ncbi:hypothetical protein C7212DRAFT_314100 [Tuber magnatum]|uniref:Uncharacterized protein n=1 Tax=Tuber magnatum TaxID=42249 RepID=A0A317STQ3_9PEZI|nr:hypothetical protein C7212DRAFT_314100 [Tuber magnatum]
MIRLCQGLGLHPLASACDGGGVYQFREVITVQPGHANLIGSFPLDSQGGTRSCSKNPAGCMFNQDNSLRYRK